MRKIGGKLLAEIGGEFRSNNLLGIVIMHNFSLNKEVHLSFLKQSQLPNCCLAERCPTVSETVLLMLLLYTVVTSKYSSTNI
jgi:hypothetical protein